jgi:hypothetical protein
MTAGAATGAAGRGWRYWTVTIVAALCGGFTSGFVWEWIRDGVCR